MVERLQAAGREVNEELVVQALDFLSRRAGAVKENDGRWRLVEGLAGDNAASRLRGSQAPRNEESEKLNEALNNFHDEIVRIGNPSEATLPDNLQKFPQSKIRLFREEIFIKMRQFLRNIGVKQGDSIVNVGTALNEEAADLPLAAMSLGAVYTGYDFQHFDYLNERTERHNLNEFGGSARHLRRFSRESSDSQVISDHSQDYVLMLTGVLSDPNPEPESDAVGALEEVLRVIKNKGKIVVGSYSQWEIPEAERIINRVLNSEEWRGKVEFKKLLHKRYIPEINGDGTVIFEIFDVYEVNFAERIQNLEEGKSGDNIGVALGMSDNAQITQQDNKKGGIDITEVPLQIKRDPNGVPLPVQFQNIPNIQLEGLSPVIINITPATFQNLPFLLSVKEDSQQISYAP